MPPDVDLTTSEHEVKIGISRKKVSVKGTLVVLEGLLEF
jgi:hypothetical protein